MGSQVGGWVVEADGYGGGRGMRVAICDIGH